MNEVKITIIVVLFAVIGGIGISIFLLSQMYFSNNSQEEIIDEGSEIDYEKELEYMNENLPVKKQEFVEICAWNVCKEFVMSIKPDGDKVIELRTNRDGFQLIFIRDGDSIPTKEEFCLELGIDLSMYMNCEHLIMNEKLDKLLHSNSSEEISKKESVADEP